MDKGKKMKKKEIIFITRMMSTGGAERVISELANEWTRLGIKVTIVQLEARSENDNYGIAHEIEVINFRNEKKSTIGKRLAEIKALKNLLTNRPKAVAISFVFSANYVLALTSFFTKNRIILSERNDPNAMSKIKSFIQVNAFRKADICVFQTKDAMNYYPKSVQKKGTIIPNPVNPDLPKRYEGERRKIIVTASRLDPQKNLKMLIDAFGIFSKDFPEYQLHIYGRAHMPGETEIQLKNQVVRLNLEEKVIFKGFVTNIHQEIVDASMYICSSNYEGISNSVLEALVMGIPTISTDCPIGGARELIKNMKNGLLTPVGDVEAMVQAMKLLANNTELRNSISIEASKIIFKYPIKNIAEKWLELI